MHVSQAAAPPDRDSATPQSTPMPLSSALQGLLLLRSDISWQQDRSQSSKPAVASQSTSSAPMSANGTLATTEQSGAGTSASPPRDHDSDGIASTDGSSSTNPDHRQAALEKALEAPPPTHAYMEVPKEMAYFQHPMTMCPPPHYAYPQPYLTMAPPMMHYEPVHALAPLSRKRLPEQGMSREDEPHFVRGRYYPPPMAEIPYDMYPQMQHMPRYPPGIPVVVQMPDATPFTVELPTNKTSGENHTTQEVVDENLDARIQNLQKLPQQVVVVLEARLQAFPGWDSRITVSKLNLLGGEVLADSSPLLADGERAESVSGYDPKRFHIACVKCGKHFTGKNALRTFELHAIFWELYSSHPSFGRLASDREHRSMYPCNSLSRDVVVFMEAKRPCLCNNQKKIWKLQGTLHHDVSLFQGRGWIQSGPDGSANVPDKTSMDSVLCCRAGKLLEQYDTLRMHVYTWHDSGVFTPCTSCRRIYQNTRAYLSHGCMRKGSDEEERVLAQCAQHMTTLLDTSPEFATWFFKMRKLTSARRDEVFDRVSKRLRITAP